MTYELERQHKELMESQAWFWGKARGRVLPLLLWPHKLHNVLLAFRAYKQLRLASIRLIQSLPRCDQCTRPATHAYRRGEARYCQTHRPADCPPYPRTEHLERLQEVINA